MPGDAARRLVLGVLPLAALVLLEPAAGFAQSNAPQQQLQDVQKRLQESRERERELGQEAAKLAQKQRELQRKLVAAARKLQIQEDLVSRSEEKLAGLLSDEATARDALETRRAELAQTLASLAHLSRQPPLAEFPDCVTERGARHLRELSAMVAAGYRAVMLFVVQRADCSHFRIAADCDPGYAAAFIEARNAGVEALCYGCSVTEAGITIASRLRMDP